MAKRQTAKGMRGAATGATRPTGGGYLAPTKKPMRRPIMGRRG